MASSTCFSYVQGRTKHFDVVAELFSFQFYYVVGTDIAIIVLCQIWDFLDSLLFIHFKKYFLKFWIIYQTTLCIATSRQHFLV